MKAINFLKQIENIDAQINIIKEKLEKLNANATGTTSEICGERVQSSGSKQKMADCVVEIVEKKEQLSKLEDRKTTIEQLLYECDANNMKVLYKRYFEYKTWKEIAVEMKFTEQYVSGKLHKKALAQFQKVLDDRKACRKNEQTGKSVNQESN